MTENDEKWRWLWKLPAEILGLYEKMDVQILNICTDTQDTRYGVTCRLGGPKGMTIEDRYTRGPTGWSLTSCHPSPTHARADRG
jgi:hypothetical protein